MMSRVSIVGSLLAALLLLAPGSALAYQAGTTDWETLGAEFAGPATGTTTVAPDGEVFVLPATGTEVIVGDGVIADDPAESDFADQVIVELPGGIGAVAVIAGIGDPGATMEAYVGGFAESMDTVDPVELTGDDERATGLYRVESSGVVTWLYLSVDAVTSPGNQIIEVVVTEGPEMASSIVLLRENITINGTPMFATVDEAAVAAIVDAQP